MTVITENRKTSRAQQLRTFREELRLHQEVARFFCKMIRKAIFSSEDGDDGRLSALLSRLTDFHQKDLTNLQKALQSLEGQTANNTKADTGRSQIELFDEGLQEARQQLNTIKREVFRELSEDFMRTRIW